MAEADGSTRPSDGGFGVSATIRLPSFSFEEDYLAPAEGGAETSGHADDSAWASKGSAGAGVIVVAGAGTQLGLHFIRLLIESRDFGSILVRGLVPAPPGLLGGDARITAAVANARASLDRFCGEDTSVRVELVAVPYFTHGHASVVVDGTVGSSLDPRLGIGAGTLKQSQCLQRAALRDAMEGCLYVISCWGSELQPVFRGDGGDGGRGVADVVGAEYGSVASLLSEAARQSAVHFVHISAILGQQHDPSHSGGNRWELGRWWSSWSLSALLYRSTNEEALLWKKRAERLVRRAGDTCGLPFLLRGMIAPSEFGQFPAVYGQCCSPEQVHDCATGAAKGQRQARAAARQAGQVGARVDGPALQ